MGPNKEIGNHISIHHYWTNRLGFNWKRGELYDRDWRFYCNLDPGAHLTFGGDEYDLVPDMFYLIPPMTPMTCRIEGTANPLQFFIHFSTGAPFDGIARGIYPFALTDNVAELIDMIITDLQKTARRGSPAGTLLCLQLVSLALLGLPLDSIAYESRDSRIRDIVFEIERDLSRKVSLETMASRAGLTKNSLIRLFNEQLGCTPYRYLTQKRLEKAIHLMEQPEYSLDRISELCGFCDRFHFSKIFKKNLNSSPGDFRRRMISSPSALQRP